MKLELKLSKIIVPSTVALLATAFFLALFIYAIVVKNYALAFASVSVMMFSFPCIFMQMLWQKYCEFASWREFLLVELECKESIRLHQVQDPEPLTENEANEYYRKLIATHDRCIEGGLYNHYNTYDTIANYRDYFKMKDAEKQNSASEN